MDRWNQAGANFTFVEDSQSGNGFYCFDHGRWNGRLAFTWTYPTQANASIATVRTVINTYCVWDPANPGEPGRDPSGDIFNLETVVTHELGHALFLGDHSSDRTSIMHLPIAAVPVGSAPKALGQDDRAGIQFLYP
jgi:hypothetical protein